MSSSPLLPSSVWMIVLGYPKKFWPRSSPSFPSRHTRSQETPDSFCTTLSWHTDGVSTTIYQPGKPSSHGRSSTRYIAKSPSNASCKKYNGTSTATSSSTASSTSSPALSYSQQPKSFSFISLPGNAVRKRPRRRLDEIERLYPFSAIWSCTSA